MSNSPLDPDHYHRHSELQYSIAKELLTTLTFSGSESVLDIGCGEGKITAELSKYLINGRIIGIDNSSSMIAWANKQFPSAYYPSLSFYTMTAEEAVFDTLFDVILCLNTFHWIRGSQKAVERMTALLKPGGSFHLVTYPKESFFWTFLDQTMKLPRWERFQQLSAAHTFLSKDELVHLFSKNELILEKAETSEHLAYYASGEELTAYVKGWLGCYLPLSEHLQELFLKDALAQAFSCSCSTPPSIQIPYLKLVVQGKKR